MKRATALALSPELLLGAADERRDAEALQAVAHALLAFTPTVVLMPPDGVLAEVQASLRCFGGPARLWQRLAEALAPLGHRLQRAQAPTALGALLLARAGDEPGPPRALARTPLITAAASSSGAGPDAGLGQSDPAWAELHRRLQGLPAAWLAPDEAACMQMEAMGLRTLADLRRQPRGGLARRFGPALLSALDRAWGLAPDPLQPIEPPLRFAARAELWARADNAEALLAGAQVLLSRLLAWAQARHARVLRFALLLHHERPARSALQAAGAAEALGSGQALPGSASSLLVSRLEIALAEPTADARHLQAVLRERLAREPLAAPVHTLGLACDEPVTGPPPDGELFPSLAGQREGLMRLVERLQARLGTQAVQRLALQPDHRPERASVAEPVTGPAPAAELPPPGGPRLTRPAWLLAKPQALAERGGRPWLGGRPLHLVAGPERIETGWWDGDLVCRDYFVAQQPEGALLWVYRLRPAPPAGEPGWFLHGRFG